MTFENMRKLVRKSEKVRTFLQSYITRGISFTPLTLYDQDTYNLPDMPV